MGAWEKRRWGAAVQSACRRGLGFAFAGGWLGGGWLRGEFGLGHGSLLEFVAEGAVVAADESTFFALAFAGFDEVLQATGAHNGFFAAFGAALVALHPELVFALPGNWQVCEFVLN